MHQVQSLRHRGRTSFHAGVAAEDIALRAYRASGYRPVAQRWRGRGGEIDLIFKNRDGFVFVEVKKSRSFAAAALRISQRQKERIFSAAEEFIGAQNLDLLTHMRFDVALVDGKGHLQIVENALWDG